METLLVLRLQISAASQNKGSICPPSGEQVAWICFREDQLLREETAEEGRGKGLGKKGKTQKEQGDGKEEEVIRKKSKMTHFDISPFPCPHRTALRAPDF